MISTEQFEQLSLDRYDDRYRDYIVTKSNALIQQSRFSLTLQENKIIAFLISQIQPDEKELNKYYEFSIVSFCDACGIDATNNTYIRKTIKKLYDRSVEIFLDGKYVPFKWIGDYEIIPQKSVIRIQIHFRMKPFLIDLRGAFTSYGLGYVLAFSNKYSIQLYEIFRSYLKLNKYWTEIEKFKQKLLVEQKYKNFSDLKRFVLDPAISEINEKSDIYVTYTTERRGNKVTALVFNIISRDPMEVIKTREKKIREIKNN